MEDKKDINSPVDVTKKSRFESFHRLKEHLMKQPPKKRLAIVGGVSFGVLTCGLLWLRFYAPKAPEPDPLPVIESTYVAPPPEPTTVASPLTGIQIEPALAERTITGVMIENSIDARPQSGLVDAGIVFEAIAEGGITRFLALFQESQPDYIGPIRSARPYYVQWAAGFDAAYAHSGGSGEALALIRSLGVKDLDHGNYSGSFDRVSTRYAPHNVYTSMARLDGLRAELGFTAKSNFTPLARIEPPQEEEEKSKTEALTESVAPPVPTPEKASTVEFNISGPLYNTRYNYDATSNTYARFMANVPHTDEKSGKQISPSVVIALYTEYSYHPNGVHSVYRTTGTGTAQVFQNGTITNATWKKDSPTASLALLDSNGEPLPLAPGQTWITAIPQGRVTYSP